MVGEMWFVFVAGFAIGWFSCTLTWSFVKKKESKKNVIKE